MRRVLPHAVVLLLAASATMGRPSPARADAAQARIHFEKGRTLFQVDEYRKAIEEFKAAHIERPDPAFLYNIAECYRHLSENKDALTYYRRFLTAAPANDRSRPAVEKRVAELQSKSRAAARAAAANDSPDVPATPAAAPTEPAPVAVGLASAPPTPAATLIDQPGSPSADTDASEPRPLYKRGAFWFAVGAVLAAGAAVAIWAAARNPTQVPGTPLGNQDTHWQ